VSRHQPPPAYLGFCCPLIREMAPNSWQQQVELVTLRYVIFLDVYLVKIKMSKTPLTKFGNFYMWGGFLPTQELGRTPIVGGMITHCPVLLFTDRHKFGVEEGQPYCIISAHCSIFPCFEVCDITSYLAYQSRSDLPYQNPRRYSSKPAAYTYGLYETI